MNRSKPQIPFGYAQGRLSTALEMTIYLADDDKFPLIPLRSTQGQGRAPIEMTISVLD